MSTTYEERTTVNPEPSILPTTALLNSPKKIIGMVLLVTAAFGVVFAVYLSTVVVKSKGATKNLIASASGTTLTGPLQGKQLPSFSLPGLQGPSSISSTLISGKPTVINFFASWCTSCQAEMATLASASRSFSHNVAFLGIDENDTASSATKFLSKYGVTYPVAFDPKVSLQGPFKLVGLPTTLFVEPNGKIYREILGTMSKGVLTQNLKALEKASK